MSLLLNITDVLTAHKLLLTGLLGLFVTSVWYFGRSFGHSNWRYLILGFVLAYNYPLMVGFYNFLLATSLMLFVLGLWFRMAGNGFRISRMALMLSVLLAATVAHPFPVALLCPLMILQGTADLALALWTRRQAGNTAPLKTALASPALRLLCLLLPLTLVVFQFNLFSWLDNLTLHRVAYPLKTQLYYLFLNGSLLFISDLHSAVGLLFNALLLGGVLLTILARVERRQGIYQKDWILAFALIMFAAFFMVPFGFSRPGMAFSYINQRCHLLALLLLLGWLECPAQRATMKQALLAAGTACLLLYVGVLTHEFYYLNHEIRHYLKAVRFIPPHSTLRGQMVDFFSSNHFGQIKYLAPYTHLFSYYAMAAPDVAKLHDFGLGPRDVVHVKPGVKLRQLENDRIIFMGARQNRFARRLVANDERHYTRLFELEDLLVFARKPRAHAPLADQSK